MVLARRRLQRQHVRQRDRRAGGGRCERRRHTRCGGHPLHGHQRQQHHPRRAQRRWRWRRRWSAALHRAVRRQPHRARAVLDGQPRARQLRRRSRLGDRLQHSRRRNLHRRQRWRRRARPPRHRGSEQPKLGRPVARGSEPRRRARCHRAVSRHGRQRHLEPRARSHGCARLRRKQRGGGSRSRRARRGDRCNPRHHRRSGKPRRRAILDLHQQPHLRLPRRGRHPTCHRRARGHQHLRRVHGDPRPDRRHSHRQRRHHRGRHVSHPRRWSRRRAHRRRLRWRRPARGEHRRAHRLRGVRPRLLLPARAHGRHMRHRQHRHDAVDHHHPRPEQQPHRIERVRLPGRWGGGGALQRRVFSPHLRRANGRRAAQSCDPKLLPHGRRVSARGRCGRRWQRGDARHLQRRPSDRSRRVRHVLGRRPECPSICCASSPRARRGQLAPREHAPTWARTCISATRTTSAS